jgi:uncharacterized protein YprB with RNaseH-like and TPR domain/predicted RNA-binding Zn-ribbon protein involved in translation (DUF1610 family)
MERVQDVLIYDIETAGVNALNADLGYIITFGYIWLSDFEKGKKFKTISIGDFPEFKKDPHNDKRLVQEALKIMSKAGGLIHHYGNKFDMPYIRTRAIIHGLDPLPDIQTLDTCFLAYKKLKLSSNRLANVCRVFNCKYRKIEKKDGWPTWWMAYLRGDLKYDKPMREYCGYDVMALADVSLKLRPYWPRSFTNALYPKTKTLHCRACGNEKLYKHDIVLFRREVHQRYRCTNCGSNSNYQKLKGTK